MKVKVYAKLNLTLNVLGMKNGFHYIDSVVTSADVFDEVTVIPRADKRVTVYGCSDIPTKQNAAYKAACAFMERFHVLTELKPIDRLCAFGADIVINKGIPKGAGMGGSSADAAAVIYVLCHLNNVDINACDVHNLCAELGSDVNYMLRGGLARLRGKGDNVEYSKLANPLYFALSAFGVSMSTAEVYSRFDNIDKSDLVFTDNAALIDVLKRGTPDGINECFNNHLQQASVSLSNYADGYLQFCRNQGLRPNMTGSGSAYYVSFNSELQAEQTVALLNANGFKTVLCRSVPRGIEII